MTDWLSLEKAWHPSVGQFSLAHCLLQGMMELNALFPNRKQGPQEGTIGDTAHRAEGSGSDHNPNSAGVVRAWDIDVTGDDFDAQALANYLARKMQQHFTIFGSLGYVIFNRRITAWQPWGTWVPYLGSDPHTGHIHLSVGGKSSEYDFMGSWNLAAAFATPVLPTLTEGLEDMRYVRFPHAPKSPAAIYSWNGSYLTWLYPADYAMLGHPKYDNLDHTSSNLYAAQCTPGTRDPRK